MNAHFWISTLLVALAAVLCSSVDSLPHLMEKRGLRCPSESDKDCPPGSVCKRKRCVRKPCNYVIVNRFECGSNSMCVPPGFCDPMQG